MMELVRSRYRADFGNPWPQLFPRREFFVTRIVLSLNCDIHIKTCLWATRQAAF
jgi:hypothetical protein